MIRKVKGIVPHKKPCSDMYKFIEVMHDRENMEYAGGDFKCEASGDSTCECMCNRHPQCCFHRICCSGMTWYLATASSASR